MKLIIVDCQKDFVSGSLKVGGADKSIENILKFMLKHKINISNIIFTVDWHPINHCSFDINGGQWPIHCVQFTEGASIVDKLLKNCIINRIPFEIITKGENSNEEEYGAFIDKQPNILDNEEVVICGIAGDFCVLHTLENILYLKPKVFLDGITSIDGGVKLKNFIKENNLDIINF